DDRRLVRLLHSLSERLIQVSIALVVKGHEVVVDEPLEPLVEATTAEVRIEGAWLRPRAKTQRAATPGPLSGRRCSPVRGGCRTTRGPRRAGRRRRTLPRGGAGLLVVTRRAAATNECSPGKAEQRNRAAA